MDEREMGGYEVTSLYVARRSAANMRNCFIEMRATATLIRTEQPKETKSVCLLYFEFVYCDGILIPTSE
jgi:hypothetical protein